MDHRPVAVRAPERRCVGTAAGLLETGASRRPGGLPEGLGVVGIDPHEERQAGHEQLDGEDRHHVRGESGVHPDLLRPRAGDHDRRHRERGELVAHEDVELEDEDVVEQAVEHEDGGAPRVSTGPAGAAADRRLPLDLESDAEHDRQQPDELPVGDEVDRGVEEPGRADGIRSGRAGRRGDRIVEARPRAGEDPDVGEQRAEDRDAAEHVERREPPPRCGGWGAVDPGAVGSGEVSVGAAVAAARAESPGRRVMPICYSAVSSGILCTGTPLPSSDDRSAGIRGHST